MLAIEDKLKLIRDNKPTAPPLQIEEPVMPSPPPQIDEPVMPTAPSIELDDTPYQIRNLDTGHVDDIRNIQTHPAPIPKIK